MKLCIAGHLQGQNCLEGAIYRPICSNTSALRDEKVHVSSQLRPSFAKSFVPPQRTFRDSRLSTRCLPCRGNCPLAGITPGTSHMRVVDQEDSMYDPGSFSFPRQYQ